ncbi:MAG: serine hydrolase domain-containing protein [Rhodanobacter sp.]
MERRSFLKSSLLASTAALSLGHARAAFRSRTPRSFTPAWAKTVSDFDAYIKAERVVGGSLYFVHDGEVLNAEHYGYADIATGRKVDADTIYHWASITKTFTGIAFMQLRDRGLVSLDDPIVKYLPVLREVHDPYGTIDQITLRQLLSHSSGFRNPTFPFAGGKPWQPLEPKEWSTIESMMPYTEIEFPPGSKYSYSNLGLSMVGRVVEIISGQHIDSYIDKNILKPLGMRDSYFDMTPDFLVKHRSNSYIIENGKPEAQGLEVDTGATLGNGGLNASLPDFVKYTNFLLGLKDNGNYRAILSRKTLQEMWVPRYPTDDIEGVNFREQMAMPFFVIDFKRMGRTTRYIGHTGSQAGYLAFFYIQPESRSAVIWVVNSRPKDNYRPMVYAERINIFNTLFPPFIT